MLRTGPFSAKKPVLPWPQPLPSPFFPSFLKLLLGAFRPQLAPLTRDTRGPAGGLEGRARLMRGGLGGGGHWGIVVSRSQAAAAQRAAALLAVLGKAHLCRVASLPSSGACVRVRV